MSNENEYLPLARLIEQGLEPGTVLECSYGGVWYKWDGEKLGGQKWNPFAYLWRIVSVPPKRIEFETTVTSNIGGDLVYLPNDHPFDSGDKVKVTIEGVTS